MQDTATREAISLPDDPVRTALEDTTVRARLLAQARAITGGATLDCDDIVQTVLQRAWAKRAEYDPDAGSVTAWLAGFVRHVALELARQRTPAIAAEGQVESVAGAEHVDELDLAETRAATNRWLASLTEPYRTAVEWRILRDREYDALAAHLQTTTVNARQLVSRGLNRLKALAAKEGYA